MKREFIDFINRLEGYKTAVKFIHWGAPNRSVHVVIDKFSDQLSDFEDEFAEDIQAIYGQFNITEANPVLPPADNAEDLLLMIRADLANMKDLLEEKMYTGALNELEDFFHVVNQTIYLIRLSNRG